MPRCEACAQMSPSVSGRCCGEGWEGGSWHARPCASMSNTQISTSTAYSQRELPRVYPARIQHHRHGMLFHASRCYAGRGTEPSWAEIAQAGVSLVTDTASKVGNALKKAASSLLPGSHDRSERQTPGRPDPSGDFGTKGLCAWHAASMPQSGLWWGILLCYGSELARDPD